MSNKEILDLVYQTKLLKINEYMAEETKDKDLIKVDEGMIINNKLMGKTVDYGILKNVDEVDCIYEVFEINKEYGGGYGFFVWDLNGNLNRYYNYKEYVKTLEEIEDLIFFEKIALETQQSVLGNNEDGMEQDNNTSGLMGNDFLNYSEKQGIFSRIIDFFKGL